MSSKLQWALTTKRFGYHIYELAKDNLRLLSLAFDPSTQTARVDFADTKRAFRIEKHGFFKSKIVLKNEYGVNIGQLNYEKSDAKEGYIDLNNERYLYTININNPEELVLYKSGEEEPLLICNLSSDKSSTGGKKKNLTDTYSHLLMTLCWFLFSPLEKEKINYGV